uniref:Odorant receptor n=1 Tax=Ceracris kiangsu TaxID=227354 RepID=A0A6M6DI54_CERKI|nr:odorant receptor 8 [Ceracris kiangsu]
MRHPRAGRWASRAFRLLNAAAVATVVVFNCSLALGIWRGAANNLDRFTHFSSHCNTITMWILRLGIIAAHERSFHHLAGQVERDFVEFIAAEDIPLLRDRGLRLRLVVRAYLWWGFAGCMWWLLYPVLCFGLTVEGMPYMMAVPYDVSQPLVFIANLLFCTVATLHVAVMTMVSDSYSVSLMVQLRLQLEILSKNLVAMARGDEETGQEKCIGKGPPTGTSQLQDRIRQNIRHHQAIIRNTELLEKCMGTTLLAQCLSIGASVCIQLYQIAMHAQRLADAGKFGCYLFIMLAQLFVYCWFGDDFITESLKVSTAAYDSVTSLEGCSSSSKRSLLLVMQRAQRPLRITAAGLFPLSREAFVAVVNMSYSFFAILRNFKDESVI